MTPMRYISTLVLAGCLVIMSGCHTGRIQSIGEIRTMTHLPPRLQQMFSKTKTVCFGRYLVDVPDTAAVAWGNASVGLGISVHIGAAKQVQEKAENLKIKLNAAEAIYHNHVPLLLADEEQHEPPGRIITGYDGFDAMTSLEIHGFFNLGNDGVVIDARPLSDNRSEAIAEIRDIAQRLRVRVEEDIPLEPGNCLENAFLVDKWQIGGKPPVEHIRIGFRLHEFPDTHLSVYVAPPDPYYQDSDTLEWQLARLERELREDDPNHPNLKTTYFRRGPRRIDDWLNGYEALSRAPEQAEAYGIHDFALDFKGVVGNPYKPYADIRMQTGVADNLAGAVKPSLTDEEAVAVWDAITSTIRVRPTTTKASAQATPRVPLGERLVSGRACSQTGWWQPAEPAAAHALPRQRIEAGATMPMAVVAAKPTPGDKLNGEQPSHEIAAVWQLVAYED